MRFALRKNLKLWQKTHHGTGFLTRESRRIHHGALMLMAGLNGNT